MLKIWIVIYLGVGIWKKYWLEKKFTLHWNLGCKESVFPGWTERKSIWKKSVVMHFFQQPPFSHPCSPNFLPGTFRTQGRREEGNIWTKFHVKAYSTKEIQIQNALKSEKKRATYAYYKFDSEPAEVNSWCLLISVICGSVLSDKEKDLPTTKVQTAAFR